MSLEGAEGFQKDSEYLFQDEVCEAKRISRIKSENGSTNNATIATDARAYFQGLLYQKV